MSVKGLNIACPVCSGAWADMVIAEQSRDSGVCCSLPRFGLICSTNAIQHAQAVVLERRNILWNYTTTSPGL